MPIVFVSVAP